LTFACVECVCVSLSFGLVYTRNGSAYSDALFFNAARAGTTPHIRDVIICHARGSRTLSDAGERVCVCAAAKPTAISENDAVVIGANARPCLRLVLFFGYCWR
jgi:hypothetical protein